MITGEKYMERTNDKDTHQQINEKEDALGIKKPYDKKHKDFF